MLMPVVTLGVPLMDKDHAHLETLLLKINGASDAALPDLLQEIEAETRAHFGREEELMQSAACPSFLVTSVSTRSFLPNSNAAARLPSKTVRAACAIFSARSCQRFSAIMWKQSTGSQLDSFKAARVPKQNPILIRGHRRARCQAEIPLIVLSEQAGPPLWSM